MTLDLIIPHYDEPYDVVKPGLKILELQQKVAPGSFRVLFINDGEEHKLPELEGYNPPYPFTEYTIPHGGVSVARNFGVDHSDADWVMFCDCDDSFVSIYSMYEILSVLDTKDYDMLWVPYYFDFPGPVERHVVDNFELTFIIGKLFRRSFLNKHNLRFNPELTYTEDTSFLHVVGMEVHPKRVGKINPNMPLTVYLHRPDSVSQDSAKIWRNSISLFRGQVYLAEENLKRKREDSYHEYVMRAITCAYATLCRHDLTVDTRAFDQEVWNYYKDRTDSIGKVSKESIKESVIRFFNELRIPEEEYKTYPSFENWLRAFAFAHSDAFIQNQKKKTSDINQEGMM